MYKIFIVEDDHIIANEVKNHLESWGCAVKTACDFNNILIEYASFEPHLILMDISLPFYNGYHWCTEIRKVSTVPIVFISSASDNLNIVMAINLGGDDFINKPFDLNVLTAKVQAILRRTYDFGPSSELLEHNGLIININDMSLNYMEQKIELTKNEFKILQTLLENKCKVVERDVLIKRLWETDIFIDENTLTVNIARLRKKLSLYGIENFLKTKKGVGYIVE